MHQSAYSRTKFTDFIQKRQTNQNQPEKQEKSNTINKQLMNTVFNGHDVFKPTQAKTNRKEIAVIRKDPIQPETMKLTQNIKSGAIEVINLEEDDYEDILNLLMNWKEESDENVINALDQIELIKFKSLNSYNSVMKQLVEFHNELKEECKQKTINGDFFEKVIDLKSKLKKIEKSGKLKLLETSERMSVEGESLFSRWKPYDRRYLWRLYVSFVSNFESALAKRKEDTVKFIQTLYFFLKKYYYHNSLRHLMINIIRELERYFQTPSSTYFKSQILNQNLSIQEILAQKSRIFSTREISHKQKEMAEYELRNSDSAFYKDEQLKFIEKESHSEND